MYCQKCGAQNDDDSQFCSSCGAPLVAVEAAPVARTYQPEMVSERTSGMAVAALVLGIIGLLINILSILAIIFGAVGMNQTGKPGVKGRGMAVAGLVLGVVTLAFWIFWLFFFSASFFYFL